MPKIIIYSDQARQALKRGINKVVDAVKVTLGPRSRDVLIARPHKGEPEIVNDGATIARNIILEDPTEEQGAQLVKSITLKTESTAGDGTTTSAILAQSIIHQGIEAIDNGSNPVLLQEGIMLATEEIISKLTKLATRIKDRDIQRIAFATSEDEQIGKTVSEVFEKFGKDVVVTIEDSGIPGLTCEQTQGYRFDKGWISPYMMTNPDKLQAVVEDTHIAILDRRITMIPDLIPLLELMIQKVGIAKLVIIAEAIEGDALATLLINKVQGKFYSLAIMAPGFGKQRSDILEDIAVFTGATRIDASTGFAMKDIKVEMLGKTKKVISTREKTVIIGGSGDATELGLRISQINTLIEDAKHDNNEYGIKQYQERLANLTGKTAIIKVGYDSEIETTRKKLKIDDTIEACRAALQEGIIPGGGLTFYTLAIQNDNHLDSKDDDVIRGYNIVYNALKQPLRQLALNSAISPDTVFEKVKQGYGFDARTNEFIPKNEYTIIDPVKVERLALLNAVSVAKTLLRAEVLIVDKLQEK